MDDIVIMLKDNATGFLEKELGSYSLSVNAQMIDTIYAEDGAEGRQVVMRLICDKEIEDWEYDAIYDYYDTEVLSAVTSKVEEGEGHYNPTWIVRFAYSDTQSEMEKIISEILELHKKELLLVYDAIADKKDEYSEE